MAENSDPTNEKKKKISPGIIVLVSILGLALVAGAIWLFSKASQTQQTTTTSTSGTSNSGLSGLISSVNLNGLHILG